MAFALVNLDLTAGSFDDALGHVSDQLQKVARNSPNYVLPTLTQNAEGPWLYKQAASRALMSAVRPDLDVGITPLNLKFDSVLGIPVDAVYPISPLIYTPISIAVLLLGDRLTVGSTPTPAPSAASGTCSHNASTPDSKTNEHHKQWILRQFPRIPFVRNQFGGAEVSPP